MSITRYTPREDSIIISNIQKNPSNLRATFEVSARQIGRTTDAVAYRYYSKLKSYNSIAVASNAGIVHLNKNAVRRQVVPEATTVRDAMLHASFSRLSKDKAITFLLSNLSNEAKNNLLIRIAQRVGGN